MANTLFIPEVFADAVNEKLATTLRFGSVAFDATSVVSEITSAGSVMHFPKLKRTATVASVVKGTALVPSVIDMSDSEAVIKYIGSAFRVYDSEKAQIKGVVLDKIIKQVTDVMAIQIDTDLSAAIDADVVFKSATAAVDKITSAELQLAIDNFGDNVDTDTFAAIIVNPKLR